MRTKWTHRSLLEFLSNNANKMNSNMINDLIKTAEPRAIKMKEMYLKYKQSEEALAIFGKSAVNADSGPNNKIPHDFWGEICDSKTGFSFGNPVKYSIVTDFPTNLTEEEMTPDLDAKKVKALEETAKIQSELDGFLERAKIRELDTRTALIQSICGTAGRILYLNMEKQPSVASVKPWECVWIYDPGMLKVQYAMRYYKNEELEEGTLVRNFYKVEWYDELNITYFIEVQEGQYMLDPDRPARPHGFKHVPLIEFPNKDTRLGDFEKVEKLINAYDFINSFNQDELEEFRAAYLKFKDADLTEEDIEEIRDTGAMSLPKGADAEWLTKVLDVAFNDSHLKRLEQNIYKFSKSVDMSDENFSGNVQSGESRKWKMKAMADDAILKEAAFESSLKDMFRVISDVWNLFKLGFESKLLMITFVENLPMDLLYHADVTMKLKGSVSEKTRLGLLPFVDNVEEEMARMAAEQENIFADEEPVEEEEVEIEEEG